MLLLLCCFLGLTPSKADPATSSKNQETETQVLMLSGQSREDAVLWDFHLSAGRGSGVWTKIAVPSCWEQEGFGAYNYGGNHQGRRSDQAPLSEERGTYRRTFDAPLAWRGQAVFIVFDGVFTDADVRINGVPLTPLHQGGFYSFSYDLSALLRYGTVNALEVVVDRNSSNASVNKAERIGDYWNFSGIFRPVWLEVRPPAHINSIGVDARADGTLNVSARISGPMDNKTQLSIQCIDTAGNPLGGPVVREVPQGAETVEIQTRILGVKTWSAETPDLYTLVLTLEDRGHILHTLRKQIGFRTFEVRAGDGLYLNGSRIVLKGVNRHCFRPDTGRTLSRADSLADILLIKGMNMNAVRMSHYPPDRHFLELCDEQGLYVLDELAGWQGSYDTPTATRLVKELVERDQNHPSILFWDNGNEGGWNTAVDDEFARWDIQKRPVLHPWALFRGMNTAHYRTYDEHLALTREKDIYMPTEFLHGLYDGGIGAGLKDYWKAMKESPRFAGGFFWAFSDEGVARTDQGGRIDNNGNTAPDGIVGPHGEKEGSYFAVQEIWSPIQLSLPEQLEDSFSGIIDVENNYDFTRLSDCSFTWKLLSFPNPESPEVAALELANGRCEAPALAPHTKGQLQVDLPATWRQADCLQISATGPEGNHLWTWSAQVKAYTSESKTSANSQAPLNTDPVRIQKEPGRWILSTPKLRLAIDERTGLLAEVRKEGRLLPLTRGPKVIVALRQDRSFPPLLPEDKLTKLTVKNEGLNAVVEASYAGCMKSTRWSLTPLGILSLNFQYIYEGKADLLGINFESAESAVQAKQWLGRGPYPAWRNRTEGGLLDVHTSEYNNPIPGETYVDAAPFKGFFHSWKWLRLRTTGGDFSVINASQFPYLGLYRLQDGIAGLYDLPELGIAALLTVPAQRNKFHSDDQLGPSSQTPDFTGIQSGELIFDFK